MSATTPTRHRPTHRTRHLMIGVVGVLAAAAVVAMPVAAGAATPDAKAAQPVKVKLFEFDVKAKPASVAPGTVRFTAKNIGTEKHEMVVVKTDGTPLPTMPDGSVDEEAIPEDAKFGEIENVKPKKSGTLTVKSLPAGNYVLFCNIVEDMSGTTMVHYAEGMSTTFTVG